MVAAARNLDRFLWLSLVMGAALLCGPFDNDSIYVKILRNYLRSGQLAVYESFRELETGGGKVQLRQCGEREIKAIRMTDAALTDEGMRHFPQLTCLEGSCWSARKSPTKG